jgi:glycosyltransferase involved in cell wall biosynthesis
MKISVIIATCNHGHWLPESIESALNQTLKPHEVIVVDLAGGSRDNTAEVVKRYPVKYLCQPGKGVSDARNHGIHNATGDWVAFLDSDDYWKPNKLERQAAAIKDEGFCYCATRRFYPDGRTEDMEYYDMPQALQVLHHHNFIDTSAGMVKRDAILSFGGFNPLSCAGEEWEVWLKLSRICKFVGVSERLLMYRVTGSGLSIDPKAVLRSMDFIVAAGTAGMPPVRRFIQARQMRSVRNALAAVKFREARDYDNTLRYACRALTYWPSPFFDIAFKVLLLELRRRVTGRR